MTQIKKKMVSFNRRHHNKKKFYPPQCDKKLTFQDCEMAILRASVDLAQEKIGKKTLNSEEIQNIIFILEDFLKRKGLICYGGQAINQELPEKDRFYNKDVEIPDYDFYSPHAMDDAKELADIYFAKGYDEVECKAGQHYGTYKVYVNFIPIADVTYLPMELFQTIKKTSLRIAGILYAPPNFLKMAMYLELSRPVGDTTRWEKVAKRLALLNKYYPITKINCNKVSFQRHIETKYKSREEEIFEVVRRTLIDHNVVFFGGYGISFYSQYMPKNEQKKVEEIADFDVIARDPKTLAEIIKERLHDIDVKEVEIVKRPPLGEVVPEQTEIRVGNEPIAVLYPPIACHSFNSINVKGDKINIATIDTMLSFYLAFMYSNKPYYDTDRIICMARFLYDVQQKNKLAQKGLLRRFTITCFGHQDTLEEIRGKKSEKFLELQNKKGTREYDEWFLNYRPDGKTKSKTKTKSRTKTNTKTKTKTKTKTNTKKTKHNKTKKIINPYDIKKSFSFLPKKI
jgi:hypothetical protein